MTITRLEEVPEALNAIFAKICEYEARMAAPAIEKTSDWLDLDALIEYLPSHPAKQTIYGLVNRKAIPCSRINGKLIFVRTEIDEWMRSKKKQTLSDIDSSANEFIKSRKN